MCTNDIGLLSQDILLYSTSSYGDLILIWSLQLYLQIVL